MNKIYSFEDSYKILGQNPSCEWSELRKSYKKLIHLWHPDRFPENSTEKEVANEKIKAINIAYNQIHAYYRKNNKLPPVEITAPPRQPIRQPGQSTEQTAATEKREKTPPTDKPDPTRTTDSRKSQSRGARTNRQRQQSPRKSAWRPSYGVLIALFSLVAFYIIYTSSTEQHPANLNNKHSRNNHHQSFGHTDKPLYPDKNEGQLSDESIDKKIKARLKHDKYFTYGDSIGKVISAQGVPDRTDGDIWYYGQSEVHFKRGQVTHWVRKSGPSLRTRINIEQR